MIDDIGFEGLFSAVLKGIDKRGGRGRMGKKIFGSIQMFCLSLGPQVVFGFGCAAAY